jgi:hypothetical protein
MNSPADLRDMRPARVIAFAVRDPIDALVPLTMSERCTAGDATLTCDASYSSYRPFQTGARLVTNR